MTHTDTRQRILTRSGGICDTCPHGNAIANLALGEVFQGETFTETGVSLCPACIMKVRRGFPADTYSLCACCGDRGLMLKLPLAGLCETCCNALGPVHVTVTPRDPEAPILQTGQEWVHSPVPFYPHPIYEPGYPRVHGVPRWTWGGFIRAWWRKLTGSR